MIVAATPSTSGLPRVDLLIDAIPTTAARVTVWRTYSGVRSVVRDANRALTGGSSTRPYTDYEVPFGVPVSYLAIAYSPADAVVAQAQSTLVTVTSDVEWISDPLVPGSGVQVELFGESLLTLSRQTPGDVQAILESSLPIAVMGVTQEAAGFPVQFKASDGAEVARILNVIVSANPFLLRVPPAAGFRIPALAYVQHSEFSDAIVADDGGTHIVLQGTLVAPPNSPVVLPVRTLGDVKGEAATLGDLMGMYDSLLEVLRGG